MEINEHQMTVVVDETAKALVPNFSTYNRTQQVEIKQSLAKAIVPVLRALPFPTTSATLQQEKSTVRRVAMDILLQELRQMPFFDTMSEEELHGYVPEEIIDQSAYSLFRIAQLALDHLPPNQNLLELDEIISNFDSLDVDEEFKKFFEK